MIACLNEPGPLSFVFMTVIVFALTRFVPVIGARAIDTATITAVSNNNRLHVEFISKLLPSPKTASA